MKRLEPSLPGGSALRALDVALVVWVVVWVAFAIVIAAEVRELGELSDTVGTVGSAAESSGAALGLIDALPVIGDAVGGALDGPAEEIQEAGRAAQESGVASRESINTLSVMLGLAVALIPSAPLLAFYLPARVARSREIEAVESARSRAGGDPRFEEFLARRAAQNLPLRRLGQVTPEPWRDLAEGRFDRLAQAELNRLGLGGGRPR